MNDKNKKPSVPEENAMSGKVDYEELRKLVSLVEENNLAVFELEIEGFKVKISRNIPAAAPAPIVAAIAAPVPAGAQETGPFEAAAPQPTEGPKGQHVITSPMVGTFYRAPDPASPPFVDIGDVVKKGQTLCIIEAMKLMNEIEADLDGTIIEIFADNARPVEYGQKLFAVQPES